MKEFWCEVIKMDKKEHGITKYNPIWTVVLLLAILSLIGVFTLQEGPLRIFSITVLSIAVGIEFFNFFIRLPAKKWRQDLDSQKAELTAEFMKTIESNDKDRDKLYRHIEALEQELRRRGWDGKTKFS